MSLLFALFLACAGFVFLALAMDRHHRQVLQGTPSSRQRLLLRTLGSLGLAVSLAICIANADWGTGLVVWLGVLSLATLVIVLLLTYWPQKLMPFSSKLTGNSAACETSLRCRHKG